jgi:uncharacterized repeat protein (TIGR03843 family)
MTTTAEVIDLLASAPLDIKGRIVNASNMTTLVQVGDPSSEILAVYKPRSGERPLWDFPTGSLHRREVAAFVVSDFLGWAIVPPTVLREDGPLGEGSVQLFVEHDPRQHYFVLVDDARYDEQLVRMAFFDILVNNADRKGSHVLRAADGHLWGCDHGLTFHPQGKLRTVIWEFGGSPLPPEWCQDLRRLVDALDDPASVVSTTLAPLLSRQERRILGLRADAVVRSGQLPDIDEERRPYPWPPL